MVGKDEIAIIQFNVSGKSYIAWRNDSKQKKLMGLRYIWAAYKFFRVLYIIINLRNVDDTTLMAESEEDLKSLLMKLKKLA